MRIVLKRLLIVFLIICLAFIAAYLLKSIDNEIEVYIRTAFSLIAYLNEIVRKSKNSIILIVIRIE